MRTVPLGYACMSTVHVNAWYVRMASGARVVRARDVQPRCRSREMAISIGEIVSSEIASSGGATVHHRPEGT